MLLAMNEEKTYNLLLLEDIANYTTLLNIFLRQFLTLL